MVQEFMSSVPLFLIIILRNRNWVSFFLLNSEVGIHGCDQRYNKLFLSANKIFL